MKIELNLLLYFVAVAEELSFRKAADRLDTAQPWLSRQIRNLEGQLGFPLFIRTTRRVQLTEKGLLLLERARAMAREAEAACFLADSLRNGNPEKLRFGVPFFALYIPERMKLFDLFHAKYPQVKLEICTGSTPEVRAGMQEGDLDAIFSTGPVNETDFEVLTLSEKPNEFLLPPNDPLAKKTGGVSIAEVAGRPVTVFPRELNPSFYDALFQIFENKGSHFFEYTNLSYTHRLEEHNAVTVIPGWSSGQHVGGVRRPILNCSSMTKFQLLKRRHAHSVPLDNFWQMAHDLFFTPQQRSAA